MAKFSGMVGFAETVETEPGIWEERIVERRHYGDVLSNIRKLEPGQSTNDNIVLNNKISIVADPYARQNYFAIRYISWMGAIWKVTNVEVLLPRLILTIGGIYNGPTD